MERTRYLILGIFMTAFGLDIRRSKDSAYLIVFLVALAYWSYRLVASYDMVLEFTDLLPWARALAGQFFVEDGSILHIIYPEVPTYLPAMMAWLDGWGISPEMTQLVLVHVSMWLGFGGVYAIAWYFSRSHWAGLVAAALLSGTWLNTLSVGYGLFFWVHHPAIGIMSGAWAIAIWALWLNLDQSRRLWPLPYLLAALLIYLHPTNALILGGSFGFAALISAFTAWPDWRAFLRPAAGIAIFFVAALPLVFSLLQQGADSGPLDSASWWALMALRKPHHVLMWSGWALASVALLVILCAVLTGLLSRHVSHRTTAQLVGTLVSCALFAAIGYTVVVLVPSPRLAGLVLSRSLDLVVAIIVAAATALAAIRMARTDGNTRRTMLASAALVVVVFGALPVEAWWTISSWSVPVFLAVFAIVSLNRRYWPFGPAPTQRMLAAFVLALPLALAAGAMQAGYQKASTAAYLLASNRAPPLWAATTAWIRDNTAPHSLLLMPPYPYGTDATRRSNVLDHLYMGYSVYVLKALPFELDALRRIYGLELSGKTIADVQQMIAEGPSSSAGCLFEQGYASLLADSARVRRLSNYYSIDYVVGFQPDAKPEQWSCVTFIGPKLDLPIVYENEVYIVYRAKGLADNTQ
jgi:hypothetical protein